jgi:hypothetical protein
VIKGSPEKPANEPKWLHQGLVIQPFTLSFTLAENMEVSGATFANGLLHIDLTRNVPEAIAPQRIAISERPALNSDTCLRCPAGRLPLSSQAQTPKRSPQGGRFAFTLPRFGGAFCAPKPIHPA